MFTKCASVAFAFTALIGLALITGFGLWMAAKLSGSDLPSPLAPTDLGVASTAPADGSAPAMIPPGPGWDDMNFTDRYFFDRMQLGTTLSEADEISVYWRFRQKNKLKPYEYFKAISEPPNTPIMTSYIVDYTYCPAWLNRRQSLQLQDTLSPLSRLEPTVMYIRRLGQQIGFSEYSCKADRRKDKARVINRICLNLPELEQEQLLYEFTAAQENGRLRRNKAEFWEIEPLVCQFDFDSCWWFDPNHYEEGSNPLQERIISEEWFNSLEFPF